MDPKIQSKNVDFYYGKKKVLKNVTIDVKEHQITALIGPSGCGKSTFLRSINRMNDIILGTRLEGEILLDGENVYAPKVDVVNLRKRVGMVFQQPNPFPKSIFDNVAFGPKMLGMKPEGGMNALVERTLRDAALWDEVKDDLGKSALELSGVSSSVCVSPACLQ